MVERRCAQKQKINRAGKRVAIFIGVRDA